MVVDLAMISWIDIKNKSNKEKSNWSPYILTNHRIRDYYLKYIKNT